MKIGKPCAPSVSKTLFHEGIHFIVTVILSIVIYFISKNILFVLVTFCLGMFLDSDHLVDYFMYLIKFKRKFSTKEFISGSYFSEWKKFITPLHSWEIVLLNVLLYQITNNVIFVAITLALTEHYLIDYLTNDVNKKAYFFLFRLNNKFVKSAIKP